MFRQHIDTAPIWEAYGTECECPLCLLRAQCEASYVENFLGASVMEPAVRMEVNEKGFCREHLKMLYDAGNRLGLALMADTHLQECIRRLKEKPPTARRSFRGRTKPDTLVGDCILCARLDNTMERYLETLLYMWKKEPGFRESFKKSRGLCFPHYEALRDMAPTKMGRDGEAFLAALYEVTLTNMERMEEELNWFTQKFDYRNRDKPWGTSADAVERALTKLRGGGPVPKKE